MRIGIDARELQGHPTGVGRYLSEILRGWLQSDWLRSDPGHEIHLFAPQSDGPLAIDGLPAASALPAHLTKGPNGTVWEQWTLPRALARQDIRVLFAPAYSAPVVAPCPVVLTMHDVSFCAHPEWFSPREGMRRRWLARACARRARAILTVSEFSAREIEHHLRVPRARLRVVPNGIDHVPRRFDPEGRWLGRAVTPHVVSLGSVFNRRHVPTLITAFARAFGSQPSAILSIAGENRTYPRVDLQALAHAAGIGDRTRVLSYATEETVTELLDRADIAVFVSEYEGFGLPMLEALARGVPVIVADTPVSHEVCGAAASFVRPGDPTALAQALTAILEDRPRVAAQLRESAVVLDRYRWNATAATTLQHVLAAGRA